MLRDDLIVASIQDPKFVERFLRKIDRRGADECWEWTGKRNDSGYGIAHAGPRPLRAHRIVWTLDHGAPPGDLGVLHSCDNPPCCNGAHFFLGTQQDNIRDMHAKGRGNKWQRPHGARHWKTFLSEPQVREIRVRVAAGETVAALSREFGVPYATLYAIAKGTAWKHLV